MAQLKVEATVAKETYELMIGIANFVGSIKDVTKDGFQPATDIPVLIAEAISKLLPAVEGASSIKTEALEDKIGFSLALTLGAVEIIKKVT